VERQTGAAYSATMRIEAVPFETWDGVLVDDVLYVRSAPTEEEYQERVRLVLLELQSESKAGNLT
jgi:hypothetical protein